MDTIKIVNADETLMEEVTKVATNSFLSEKITSSVFNLNKNNVQEPLYRLNLLKFKFFHEKGEEIFAALKNNQVVGAAVLTKNTKITWLDRVKTYFPDILFFIVPLIFLLNLKRLISISKCVKTSVDMKKPYYTLEVIGVDPHHQGRGIGKMLLNKVNELAEDNPEFSGIYLFTGDKKTQILYEKVGYETIEECPGPEITIYHLFRKNKKK